MSDTSSGGSAELITTEKRVALIDEVAAVIKLCRHGIGEIWQLDGANDLVHLPLQLLAQGFERLLKVAYATSSP